MAEVWDLEEIKREIEALPPEKREYYLRKYPHLVTKRRQLMDKLNDYARQVTAGGEVRLMITPEVPYGLDWLATTPHILEEVLLLAKDEEVVDRIDQDEAVAVLAHEAGHLEQNKDMRDMVPILPPIEIDAWRRGIKWAHKWGVLPVYATLFLESVAKTPEHHLAILKEDVQRIKAHIDQLLIGERNGREPQEVIRPC